MGLCRREEQQHHLIAWFDVMVTFCVRQRGLSVLQGLLPGEVEPWATRSAGVFRAAGMCLGWCCFMRGCLGHASTAEAQPGHSCGACSGRLAMLLDVDRV